MLLVSTFLHRCCRAEYYGLMSSILTFTGFADKGRLGIGNLSDWNPQNPFVNTPYLVEGLSKVFIKKVEKIRSYTYDNMPNSNNILYVYYFSGLGCCTFRRQTLSRIVVCRFSLCVG